MSLNYKVIGNTSVKSVSATTFRKRCSLNWWIKRHLTSAT